VSEIRRIGLTWEPPEGWPLALRTGVTPQGCRKALVRLERGELVHRCVADEGSAARFALDLEHPLVPPLRELFEAERASVRSAWPDRARP